nr:trypsin CFT-1-like [Maniola hyperantus]
MRKASLYCTRNAVRLPVANSYRIRVGSTNANSGGYVHNAARVIGHPQYNTRNHNNDVGVVRVATAFVFGNTVRAAALSGPNINIPDNANVIALGWGATTPTGSPSEQLRHVQIRTVNQERCQALYGGGTSTITANMLCAGWDAGGRGSCFGDSGTGLIYKNVIVGVTSFGRECASSRWPGVYARVSRFITWIENNA